MTAGAALTDLRSSQAVSIQEAVATMSRHPELFEVDLSKVGYHQANPEMVGGDASSGQARLVIE